MMQQNPDAYNNAAFWESTEELVEVHSDPFWDQLPILQQIRDWSCYHQRNPWGVLMVLLARAAFLISPHVLVSGQIDADDDPGKLSPLNLYVCGAAASGTGKGATENAVRSMLPDPPDVRSADSNASVTSGEGLKAFYGRMQLENSGNGEPEFRMKLITPRQWVSVAEISSLTGNANRTGSTIEGTLNEAWSGSTLSQINVDQSKQVIIPKNAYRLCVYVCAQPARAEWLLTADGSGLAQRFLWCPITILTPSQMFDIRVPMPHIDPFRFPHGLSRTEWERAYREGVGPKPLILMPPDAYRYAAYCLQNEAAADPFATRLDSHVVQSQLRVAAVIQLSLMNCSNGLHRISNTAWDLAGQVMKRSKGQLSGFMDAVRDANAHDQASKIATRLQAQDEADDLNFRRKYTQISNSIMGMLAEKDPNFSGIKGSELRKNLSSSRRGSFNSVIDRLYAEGTVERLVGDDSCQPTDALWAANPEWMNSNRDRLLTLRRSHSRR